MFEPRLSLITLGVADPARSKAFYEALGFKAVFEYETTVFFPLGPLVLGLFRKPELDSDMNRVSAGPGAMSLAYNTRTPDEVDSLIDLAVASGASLLKAPEKVFWGGYSGYFADPDGHAWEVAHNPHWTLAADGGVRMDA